MNVDWIIPGWVIGSPNHGIGHIGLNNRAIRKLDVVDRVSTEVSNIVHNTFRPVAVFSRACLLTDIYFFRPQQQPSTSRSSRGAAIPWSINTGPGKLWTLYNHVVRFIFGNLTGEDIDRTDKLRGHTAVGVFIDINRRSQSE